MNPDYAKSCLTFPYHTPDIFATDFAYFCGGTWTRSNSVWTCFEPGICSHKFQFLPCFISWQGAWQLNQPFKASNQQSKIWKLSPPCLCYCPVHPHIGDLAWSAWILSANYSSIEQRAENIQAIRQRASSKSKYRKVNYYQGRLHSQNSTPSLSNNRALFFSPSLLRVLKVWWPIM